MRSWWRPTGLCALVALAVWLAAGGCAGAADAPSAGLNNLLPGLTVYGPLAEIPAGHWAYRALEDLIEAGVIVEYTPGLLDGEHTISRYEAAMLLVDAFRRAHAVDDVAQASGGTASLRALSTERLLSEAARTGLRGDDAARLRKVLAALGRELSGELSVLGYRLQGPDDGAPPAGPRAVALEIGGAAGGAATPALAPSAGSGAAAGASGEATLPPGSSAGVTPDGLAPQEASGSLPRPSYTYRLGVSLSEPGHYSVAGVLPLGAAVPAEFGAFVSVPRDQWLWTRIGAVGAPGGSLFAVQQEGLVGLEGIEARLMGRDVRTGVMVATDPAAGSTGTSGDEQGKVGAIAALDSSLVLGRDVVVGAAIVRGAPSTAQLFSAAEGSTVTSVTTRYRASPWLTLTGEYAQNLWALPVLDAAMRLDATLHLGDVRVGASVGNVAPQFKPAMGTLRPGARLGVDTAVRVGEVELRAGTNRLNPADGGSPEVSTLFGVSLGSPVGPSLDADVERISVEQLASERTPDRTRTTVRLGWGGERTRLSMGVAWTSGPPSGDQATPQDRGLEAQASVAYQLTPGAMVVFGYRLIDFGRAQETTPRANASAQISVSF